MGVRIKKHEKIAFILKSLIYSGFQNSRIVHIDFVGEIATLPAFLQFIHKFIHICE
jgi:hypothetical protein